MERITWRGASLLTSAGLQAWIAEDWDDYVNKAINLVRDRQQVTQLRQGLRSQLRHSPLCQAERTAWPMQAAFRAMWQAWCQQAAQRGRCV